MSDATDGVTTPAPAPVCFRHPDRVSYVKCTRCARPICPDCMISASVGFQCPDCVHGAAASAPRIKTSVGAPAVEKPTVTYALIGINVFAFLLMLVSGIDQTATQWGMFPPSIAIDNEWWRLVTSAFLHGGWLHIAFNMYVLYALGPSLERVLGHSRYLVLYLMAALGGAVCSYAFSDVMTVSVGASGAIFGLMGALVVAGRKLRYDITQVLILLAVNFAIGFMAPGVDWRAHVGGMVVGAAVAAIFVLPPARIRMPAQVLGIIAVLVVLVVITMVRTAQIMDMVTPVVSPGLSA
ncbi:MAG: rhomboid family intramembrane serine protease [Candidatus Nanopelagicales bacterium]